MKTGDLLVWAFREGLFSGVHPPVTKRGAPTREEKRKSDARWNQIFEEKFADPDYYSELKWNISKSNA